MLEQTEAALEKGGLNEQTILALEARAEDEQLLVDRDQKTRFIVQVSNGVVQQEIDRIGNQKQMNPNDNFHAHYKTGKNGVDLNPVLQEAQALVNAFIPRPLRIELLGNGTQARCANDQSLGDGFTLEGCAAAALSSETCSNIFFMNGSTPGQCDCATDDCQDRTKSSHDIFQVQEQDRVWVVASFKQTGSFLIANAYCPGLRFVIADDNKMACAAATFFSDSCKGNRFSTYAGNCYCSMVDCQRMNNWPGFETYEVGFREPKIHGIYVSKEKTQEMVDEVNCKCSLAIALPIPM